MGTSTHCRRLPDTATYVLDNSFTPTRTSWLNQVEIWFSILEGKSLQGACFTSVGTWALPRRWPVRRLCEQLIGSPTRTLLACAGRNILEAVHDDF